MPHQSYLPDQDRPDEMRSGVSDLPELSPHLGAWWRRRSLVTAGVLALAALAGVATWIVVEGLAVS
jgi:hypothetical protein